MTKAHAIKIAITAMGGQGGGVLANWIVQLGEKAGFIAQMTSVPGVAQRTGATVYYVELFPLDAARTAGKEPVLALMPAPGDVDIVIAAELMEAGRALKRGFVTGKTMLIASTHRDYAISEKIGLGDARRDASGVLARVSGAAGGFIGADMATAAAEAGSVISAVLFGALAGSRALPITRDHYEDVIRAMGRAVDANLHGFSKGLAIAEGAPATYSGHKQTAQSDAPPAPAVSPPMNRLRKSFPAPTHFYICEGLKRLVDFQDVRYAEHYLDRLEAILQTDRANGGERRDFLLTQTVAKYLALWMTYEDTIRVADLKTRKSRFARFRNDVRAENGQIVDIREFMHPRVEEICDLLPPPIARFILGENMFHSAVKLALGAGRRVSTTKLRGFLPLYFLAGLRSIRRSSYRYHVEQARIEAWLAAVLDAACADYDFGVAMATMQRLIKGYGETHARGLANFNQILAVTEVVKQSPDPAKAVTCLIEAALKDEEGAALKTALAVYAHGKQAA